MIKKLIMNRRGEEDKFKNFVIGFILFALFGMLILVVVQNVGTDYGKDLTQVGGEGSLNLASFNNSISEIESTAKSMNEVFQKETTWSTFGFVVVTGFLSIAKQMTMMIFTPFAIMSNILQDVLHVPVFVTSTILGALVLAVIFAFWSLLRVGN